MRKFQYLLITLAALLLSTGCTTFQAAEARRAVTVGLFESVLEGAIDELLPVEKSAHRQYKDDIKERAEDARRKQEREVRHYEKEANSMLDALDEAERDGILDRISAEKRKGKVLVTRFKGLGEMSPLQLRESTMSPDTRRLVKLTLDAGDKTNRIMDMLLSKKRASDRREWLEKKGDKAEV